jgi:murein DD-endopeptidase MepM/ murein hydrolase activator NlpD
LSGSAASANLPRFVGPLRAILLAAACAVSVVPAAAAKTDHLGRSIELRWPAKGTLTSPFGWDADRDHSGLDIGILRSLDVTAAEEGVVTRAGTLMGYEGYGTIVEVRLNERFSTLYAHLASVFVAPGDRVAPYQKIAVAGCTGSCTGTHLHFELRDRGRPVDPTLLMAR